VWYARRTQSYVFLLLAISYGYVASTSALVILGLFISIKEGFFPLAILYFPLSLIGLVWLLINIKKILRIA
jgi:hypothetical protein